MGIGQIGFLQSNPAGQLAGGFNSGFDTTRKVQDAFRGDDARNLFAQAAQTGQVNPLLAAASPQLFQQAQANQSAQATAQSDAEQAGIQRQLEGAARDSKTALSITNPALRQEFLQRRVDEIDLRPDGDSSHTRAIMALPFEQQNIEFQDAINQVSDLSGSGSNIQSSQFIPGVGFATVDKSGTGGLVPIEGVGETASEKRAADMARTAGTAQAQSDIAVQETEKKEVIKQRVARASKIKGELGDRNRSAARSGRLISEALTFAENASQGLSGAGKLKLSKLLPGIDAGDEAGLDSALKQLALEQLQNFKGPTTDFEFGVTENIVGGVGNSKESNRARLKSLQRATWFNQREFDQFRKHTAKGGDADSFSFNFGEPIDTKKGVFTLQQLQDTAVQNNISIDDVLKRLDK